MNGSEKGKTGGDLLFRPISFHDGTDDSNIDVLGAYVVRRGHHGDVNIYSRALDSSIVMG